MWLVKFTASMLLLRGGCRAFLHMGQSPVSPRDAFDAGSRLRLGVRSVFAFTAARVLSASRVGAVSSSAVNVEVAKSAIDEREYKALTLTNGMRVLLISDPSSVRSAAALDVHVGSFSDPSDIPGLAHFCEHMLFLGTTKYPKEDAYSSFLSSHGGSSNAYTSSEDTCYYFDINADYLDPALDRFSQFFISPLFTPNATSRELNAVDSEHSKNINNDAFRIYQLEKQASNPAHPNSRFSTGNKYTLETVPLSAGVDLREALLKYHGEHYSANLMTLAILGKDSLPALEKLARGYFSAVPSTGRANPSLSWWGVVPPYLPQQTITEIDIVPISESRRLLLSWNLWLPSPSARDRLDHAKPDAILTHLLGHESSGSLKSFLISKGWINSITSYLGNDLSDLQQFDVSMDLTVEGLNHKNDIIRAVFAYLDMLRTSGIPLYIYEEVAHLSKINFKFSEKADPSSLVSSVVSNMQQFSNPAEYLTGPRVVSTISPQDTIDYLSRLTANECRIKLIANELEGKTTKKEKWYQTAYSEFTLPKEMEDLSKVSAKDYPFHVPSPNLLIPARFDLLGKKPEGKEAQLQALMQEPARLDGVDADKWTLWYKLDKSFQQPKTYAILSLAVPAALYDSRFLLQSMLFNYCFTDSISELVYDASLANLSFTLEFTSKGVQLIFSGFSDKFFVFASNILSLLKAFKASDTVFRRYKDVLARELSSWKTQQPYQHSSYYANLATETLQFPIEDLVRTLPSIELSQVNSFLDSILSSSFGTALITGNVDKTSAVSFVKQVQTTFPFVPLDESLRSRRVAKSIPSTASSGKRGFILSHPEPNTNDDNSAVAFYYQLPQKDTKSTSTLELLAEVLDESFYNVLRTQQQLGYIVYSGLRFREGVYMLVFTVQSNTFSTSEIRKRVLAFVDKAIADVDALTPKAFESFKEGIVSRKLEPDQRLTSQASRLWSEIILADNTGKDPNFMRHYEEAKILEALDIADFKQFAKSFLSSDGANHRLLVSEIISSKSLGGQTTDGVEFVKIPDALSFMKAQAAL